MHAEPNSKIENEFLKANDLELDELMADFNPYDDRIDKILLYMLTGRNLDNVMKDWIREDDPGPILDFQRMTIQGNDEPLL